MLDLFIKICYIAISLWIASYLQYSFMQHAAEEFAFHLRMLYMRKLMQQDTTYFES